MKLNFFCDVDGTLLPFGKGLPESALKEIEKVQREGHSVFVATGRNKKEMDPRLSIINFDGGVYSAGATVEYKNKEIFRKRMTESDISFLLSYAEKKSFYSLIQTDEGTYMTQESYDFFISSMKKYIGGVITVPNLIVYSGEIPKTHAPVCKFLFLSSEHKGEDMRTELKGKYQVVDNTVGLPQSDMAEICQLGITKATGIKEMLKYLGEDISSSVAIGDGANDNEMIEEAGLGIAMGNADDDVKRRADYVTTDVCDNGLKNALEYAITINQK